MPKKGTYDVGYKKPPKYRQYPPGQSGNPSGRTATAKGTGTAAALHKVLSQKVEITENGRKRIISHEDFLAKKLFELAAKGDIRAIKQIRQEQASLEYQSLTTKKQHDEEWGLKVSKWFDDYIRACHTLKQFMGLEQILGQEAFDALYLMISSHNYKPLDVTNYGDFHMIKLKKLHPGMSCLGPWDNLASTEMPEAARYRLMRDEQNQKFYADRASSSNGRALPTKRYEINDEKS